MPMQRSRDLILALKKARKERGYSLTRVEEEILRRGKSLSESTLKRVFRDGSEDAPSYPSYEHTLLPIAEVFPEVWAFLDSSEPSGSHEIELLEMELRVQAGILESKLAQIKILEDRVAFMREQIDVLKQQIEIKDRRMDEREAVIRKVMEEREELRSRLEALTSPDSKVELVQFPGGSVLG